MKDDKKFIQWLNFAEQDLIASKLLYFNKLHNHSIYFLSQSAEKIFKTILFFNSYIKEGKEIGHNFNLGFKKIYEHFSSERIQKHFKQLNIKDSEDYRKNIPKVMSLLKKDQDLSKVLFSLYQMKKGYKSILISDKKKLFKSIKRFDKELVVANKTYKKLEKTLKEKNKFKTKKEYFDFLIFLAKSSYTLLKYPVSVTYSLAHYFPEQNSLRYPGINKKEHLVTHFDKISFHLEESIDKMRKGFMIKDLIETFCRKK